MSRGNRDDRLLRAADALFRHLGERLDLGVGVELWDGRRIPLGPAPHPELRIALDGPWALGAVARRPTLDTVVRQYAAGAIDVRGGDLFDLVEAVRARRGGARKLGFKQLRKGFLLRQALPFLRAPRRPVRLDDHAFGADATGRARRRRREQDFIQFHYDISNDFYRLFLDQRLVYSCAYFTDWSNDLDRAQHDKLDMICRKLRLAPGERFLDVGCGWGALVVHAAERYGVRAHGVTLSQAQLDVARSLIEACGLGDRVTVELRDYATLEGTFDKIASIGMYEHIGLANHRAYFAKLHGLLRDRGILLNHGITRRAKRDRRRFRRITPEKRMILKYIFPGSELDHVGHTIELLEAQGFEVHDVEGWREHYALTCRHWHKRLAANADAAIRLVGPERFRLWLAYLAGVGFAFEDGSLRIFQVVATKHKAKGPSTMPPTRAHLYHAG